MVYVYLACLVIGGVVLLGSLLLGSGDHDADGDADADGDGDVHVEGDHDGADHGVGDAAGLWLPFFSVRFWVFGLCFFGLCGTLLTFVQAGAMVTPVVSGLVGLGCGTGAAYVVRRLGAPDRQGGVVNTNDFVGLVATVLVPVGGGSRGKVRVSVKEQHVDLIATTGDEVTYHAGQPVLIVEYDDHQVTVTQPPLAESTGD
jgi:hypothetical protein